MAYRGGERLRQGGLDMGEQGKVRGQGRSKCHVDGEEGWTSRGEGGDGD